MAIQICPTSGEACGFIPFNAVDTANSELPSYTELCKTRTDAGESMVKLCGFYVELGQRIAASGVATGGNE